MNNVNQEKENLINAGLHFGYSKSSGHPSVRKFISTVKKQDYINIESLEHNLEQATNFLVSVAKSGGKFIVVSTKEDLKLTSQNFANSIDMPYVSERWIGGTLTNFPEILKRIKVLKNLILEQKSQSQDSKLTKKEKSLLDKEIKRMKKRFEGLLTLETPPKAIFLIDSKKEKIALIESLKMKIPIVSISNTDCNIYDIDYPIVANDSSRKAVNYLLEKIKESLKK